MEIFRLVGPELSEGGAPYSYKIFSKDDELLTEIKFQNGAPDEHGVNGCTIEQLINICIDRPEQFRSGGFPCKENYHSIIRLREAEYFLMQRTKRPDKERREAEKQSK